MAISIRIGNDALVPFSSTFFHIGSVLILARNSCP
nr:MAG TPA: hypothetical protein [Caudoviricetes sp.]